MATVYSHEGANKSPLMGAAAIRISDLSKNTDYIKNIIENKTSTNKTNTTLQHDQESEIENGLFNKE